MGRTAPTPGTTITSGWASTTSPRNSAAAVVADVVVVAMLDENMGSGENYTFTDDQSDIFSEHIPSPLPTIAGDVYGQLWTGQDIFCTSVSLTRTTGGAGQFFGFHIMPFNTAAGWGTAVSDVTASQINVTTTQPNSAVVVLIGDYAATDMSLGSLIQVNATNPAVNVQMQQAGAYSGTILVYANVGAAGTKTVGMTGLTGATPIIMAIEVIGAPTNDPGYGKIVLEDSSGNLEMENTTDDYLLDTAESAPPAASARLVNVRSYNPAVIRSFIR